MPKIIVRWMHITGGDIASGRVVDKALKRDEWRPAALAKREKRAP
jgi:hypothetical protein